MTKLKIFVEDLDMFAFKVRLNFNGRGDAHKTLIGGVASIFIYIVMLTYFGFLLDRVINLKEVKTDTFWEPT